MTRTIRRPGPESTLDEVKEQLIQAAITLLQHRGVDVGLGEIALSDAIVEAGVTRSTAYRSLADDDLAPQAVLHRELLEYLLMRYSRGTTIERIGDAVGTELSRQADNLASSDVALRTHAMRSVLRVGCNRSYLDVVESCERSVLTAIYGALRSQPTDDWRREALIEGERGLTTVFNELYGELAKIFQYKVKPPFTMGQFSAAGASLIEGIAMRHGISVEVETALRATGANGELEEWTLFASAFEAMFTGFCEPVDVDSPFADLLNY